MGSPCSTCYREWPHPARGSRPDAAERGGLRSGFRRGSTPPERSTSVAASRTVAQPRRASARRSVVFPLHGPPVSATSLGDESTAPLGFYLFRYTAGPSPLARVTALLYYLAYFGVLVACGLGLPVPEEVTLIGAGYASHLGKTNVVLATVVCGAGILAGDTCLFVLGRLFGLPLARRWPFRRHLTPERIERLRAAYARYGARLIFLVRVVPVVRAVAHFTAGTLRFRYLTFAAMDGLGITLTVPISVWLAYYFGSQIDDVTRWIQKGNLTVTAVAGAALLILWLWHRRGVRAAAAAGAAPCTDLATGPPAGSESPAPVSRRPEA